MLVVIDAALVEAALVAVGVVAVESTELADELVAAAVRIRLGGGVTALVTAAATSMTVVLSSGAVTAASCTGWTSR
jgi:hypothetical protein